MPARKPPVYQLKISLAGAKPPIWRRVLVDSTIMFRDLHRTIQVAMGWQAYHLHHFQLDSGVLVGDPSEDMDGMMNYVNEAVVPVSAMLMKEGSRVRYEYDFGDGWEHDIRLEKILPGADDDHLPQCSKAVRQCPPEDIGGLPGYYHFLDAMRDPAHPDHVDIVEWMGGEPFDPDAVDLEQINDNLDRLFAQGGAPVRR